MRAVHHWHMFLTFAINSCIETNENSELLDKEEIVAKSLRNLRIAFKSFFSYTIYLYFARRYFVTDRRIIFKKGILFTTKKDIPLKSIEGIEVKRNIFNRLVRPLSLGFFSEQGDVVVKTPGGKMELNGVVSPSQFQNAIQKVMYSEK